MSIQTDGLMTVRNCKPGPTLFSDQNSNMMIEWQGAGDPQGGDIQQVPRALINNMAFAKSLRKGVLEVIEADDEIANLLSTQAAQQRALDAKREQETLSRMDEGMGTDMVGYPCLGPGERAGVLCGVMVPMSRDQLEQRPPLCAKHAHLASNFVLSYQEGALDERGRPVPVWLPVTTGEALPNQSRG